MFAENTVRRAMGFNAVSFYIFWGIHEPKRGEISFEGFRDLQPFIDAAKKAGIYLVARPGPYINAETTGGGFPGWGTYTPGIWRTSNTTYLDAYAGYVKAVGATLAANQITQGGPIILVQSENEYSGFQAPYTEDFVYESKLMQAFLDTGITVPITTNDAWAGGHYTTVDVYGYDSYPNGFDCSHPNTWASNAVPDSFWDAHMSINPEDLNAVYEFQGGAFDGWGGSGYDTCAILTGTEFERVFYKNEIAMSTTYLNLYMIYGGTNWGGIAHPGVYTSYDYGSAIAEDRTLREKFYELKLQANFLAVSPAYLTTRPQNIATSQGAYTGNSALKTTQILDVVGKKTGFYVVRQTDASTNAVQTYTLTLPTSLGTLTVPTLGGSLTLTGKDSKIHVVDYTAGSTTLLYSTAEIMTWATIDGRDIILVYGNAGELHETAIKFASATAPAVKVLSGSGTLKQKVLNGGALALQFTTSGQTVVQVGSDTLVYILDRANAYQFWVLHPPTSGALAQFSTENPIIIKGGYLIRSVNINGGTLALTGDLNNTASFEIIAPAAQSRALTFNGTPLPLSKTSYGTLTAKKTVTLPPVSLPNLSTLPWKMADSLPEITSTYSDALWTVANHTTSANPTQLSTPVSLYAGDYGYHTGNILWRAHFNATGTETAFKVHVIGGAAFGYSVWLDSTFIGSWEGNAVQSDHEGTFSFSTALAKSSNHIITILQDHMGLEEDWVAASETFKTPRGILSYSFVGSPSTNVNIWKVAGNLGGENYADRTRGPLNEGGLFAERQGFHLPGFNDASWTSGNPTTGISKAGVSIFRTEFNLSVPQGVDYPIAIVVTNSTTNPHFRSQFYVNGYQFGKYAQGILNYQGENTLAVSLWAAGAGGAKLDSLKLALTAQVESSMAPVVNQPLTPWAPRPGAF
ncbi:Beta-galactosidase A [Psilocybe cubensis]|uniref:Beta-galactosidase A n=1 Tax=Psilocybe cubensis TaxID=181762 RepID=A0ACB8H4E8_PSICU|nr:Beta-galactosidase A [Psilocybe cubensis]KAH9482883.1 Beta-galactosidase A [Psilocybe cubensis]